MSLGDSLRDVSGWHRKAADAVDLIAVIRGGIATNTGNAYVLTTDPIIDRYLDGQTFRFFVAANNTGAATLAVSNAAAKSLRMGETGLALVADDLSTGYLYEAYYRLADDRFYLSTPWASGSGGGGGLTVPEYSSDPASPAAEDIWILRSGSVSGGGEPTVPFPLLFTTAGAGSYSYELSYRTAAGTTIRVSMS